MELRHLRYFLTVCEEMNFTKAAEKLMIAQPPLSRQIRDLEEEIGTPLFIRGHHTLSLTEEGVMFRQYASRIVGLADRSVDDIRQMHSGLRGTLYVASVEGRAPHIIANWISEFSKAYPDVQYSLWNGTSDEVSARIKKGLCEVAVIMEPYNPDGLHSVQIYEEPWIAMCSEKHPLAKNKKQTITADELVDYELIIPSRASRLQEINDWLKGTGKTANVRARIANVLNAYELCRQNVGVAIFPAASMDIVNDKSICIKTINDPNISARYVLIYSDEHTLSPVAQRFVDFLNEENLVTHIINN